MAKSPTPRRSHKADWGERLRDEILREGDALSIRELVLYQLERGEDPQRKDLATALAAEPKGPSYAAYYRVPAALLEYTVRTCILEVARKPGRKAAPRSTWSEIHILSIYERELVAAEDARDLDRGPKAVKAKAAEATGQHFKVSARTIKRIVDKATGPGGLFRTRWLERRRDARERRDT